MMSPILGCTNLNCQTKIITKSNLREIEKGNVTSAYFSRDGKYIVTTLDDNAVGLRDVYGKQISLLKGHQDKVYDVVFSPDGKKVVTSYRRKTVQITDISELIKPNPN